MRQADVAIRSCASRPSPTSSSASCSRCHFHLFASPAYIKRFGSPKTIEDIDQHRIITFGVAAPNYLRDMNWLESVGRPYDNPRLPALRVNNLGSPSSIRCSAASGIALLPDYIVEEDSGLQQLIPEVDLLS